MINHNNSQFIELRNEAITFTVIKKSISNIIFYLYNNKIFSYFISLFFHLVVLIVFFLYL
jgi:hypothetical protein